MENVPLVLFDLELEEITFWEEDIICDSQSGGQWDKGLCILEIDTYC